jgi:hypothetical protein
MTSWWVVAGRLEQLTELRIAANQLETLPPETVGSMHACVLPQPVTLIRRR